MPQLFLIPTQAGSWELPHTLTRQFFFFFHLTGVYFCLLQPRAFTSKEIVTRVIIDNRPLKKGGGKCWDWLIHQSEVKGSENILGIKLRNSGTSLHAWRLPNSVSCGQVY